jgi:hypothetical protein
MTVPPQQLVAVNDALAARSIEDPQAAEAAPLSPRCHAAMFLDLNARSA